jgi:AcrR family transcriptional regulator
VARWEPDAEDRLRRAAVDLYLERGFEDVSVAEISERAGLARRTFFRYFADKREVLFAGAEQLPIALAAAARAAGPDLAPLDVALGALRTVGIAVVARVDHEQSRARRAVIRSSPELQERERTKLAACTSALAEVLQERGVAEETSAFVARVAVAVFETAFARWGERDGQVGFTDHFDHAVVELAAQFSRRQPLPNGASTAFG